MTKLTQKDIINMQNSAKVLSQELHEWLLSKKESGHPDSGIGLALCTVTFATLALNNFPREEIIHMIDVSKEKYQELRRLQNDTDSK